MIITIYGEGYYRKIDTMTYNEVHIHYNVNEKTISTIRIRDGQIDRTWADMLIICRKPGSSMMSNGIFIGNTGDIEHFKVRFNDTVTVNHDVYMVSEDNIQIMINNINMELTLEKV